jgi:hypothetical protein
MSRVPDLQSTVPAATGRFANTLRAAIQASGLSLNRIEHRLRERGGRVDSPHVAVGEIGVCGVPLATEHRHDAVHQCVEQAGTDREELAAV